MKISTRPAYHLVW